MDMEKTKKPYVIEVYTLAEKNVFWALIHNFLGWAHEGTYHPIKFEPVPNFDVRAEELMKMFVEKGGRLLIHHLFKPFVKAEDRNSFIHYHDDSLKLIRRILKTEGLQVKWDIADDEKSYLQRYSPPIYDKIFKKT